jgi:hypothetical protein
MSEEEKKGFRVVDRRGMEKEEPKQDKADPAPRPEGDAGNRLDPGSVHGKKGPEEKKSRVGGPSFLDLVMSLQMGAMVNLGMVQTEDGRRSPTNLPAAKDSIDLLDVLKEKTKGNLTEEESGILSEGLYHLRMTYVAAVKAGVSAPTAEPGQGGKKT